MCRENTGAAIQPSQRPNRSLYRGDRDRAWLFQRARRRQTFSLEYFITNKPLHFRRNECIVYYCIESAVIRRCPKSQYLNMVGLWSQPTAVRLTLNGNWLGGADNVPGKTMLTTS